MLYDTATELLRYDPHLMCFYVSKDTDYQEIIMTVCHIIDERPCVYPAVTASTHRCDGCRMHTELLNINSWTDWEGV